MFVYDCNQRGILNSVIESATLYIYFTRAGGGIFLEMGLDLKSGVLGQLRLKCSMYTQQKQRWISFCMYAPIHL